MKRSIPARFSRQVDAVALGASAGGIDALLSLLGQVRGLRASVIVVLHLPADHDSRLPEVFAARTALPVREAVARAPVEPGTLYFAPPGYHLLVEHDHTFALNCDEPVLYSRPSIDVLMQSCADAWGERLAAMVLTGANEDGAAGLAAVAAAGGLTAVQDPAEALHPTMPQAALDAARPDFVLPLQGLSDLIARVAA